MTLALGFRKHKIYIKGENKMSLKLSFPLVETGWLEDNLNDPSLRVIDCHYDIQKNGDRVSLTSGRTVWDNEHIPKSIYYKLTITYLWPNNLFQIS